VTISFSYNILHHGVCEYINAEFTFKQTSVTVSFQIHTYSTFIFTFPAHSTLIVYEVETTSLNNLEINHSVEEPRLALNCLSARWLRVQRVLPFTILYNISPQWCKQCTSFLSCLCQFHGESTSAIIMTSERGSP